MAELAGQGEKCELLNFWKQMIAFRKAHPILHPVEELRILDSLSCGYPDLSYHGQNAWRPQTESYNRHVGIMYCGKYAKTPQGWGGFFPLCCHEYALGAAETGISKAAEGYGMESCAGNGEGGRYLTVQEKEEQSREQTGIIAPEVLQYMKAL